MWCCRCTNTCEDIFIASDRSEWKKLVVDIHDTQKNSWQIHEHLTISAEAEEEEEEEDGAGVEMGSHLRIAAHVRRH